MILLTVMYTRLDYVQVYVPIDMIGLIMHLNRAKHKILL